MKRALPLAVEEAVKTIEAAARLRDQAAAALDRRLTEYLRLMDAGLPKPNPNYDPANAAPFHERRGGRGNPVGTP
jgi:hypothetical protein